MSLYAATVPQLSKMLHNLERWLEEAETHAEARGFEPEVLLGMRLSPDQFPLLRQVQAACDAAKFAVARLVDTTPPVHEDTEQTLPEIRARIASVAGYIEGFGPADFAGAGERLVPLSFIPGKAATSGNYLNEFALPNFYFHVVTAYAILRHAGVKLGKRTYIGAFDLVDL